MAKKRTAPRMAPSSLGPDGKKSPPVRWRKDGAVRMSAPGGAQFSDLVFVPRGSSPTHGYQGGMGPSEPELTASEKLNLIRRLVHEKGRVDDRELAELIESDRRRGLPSRSWKRDDLTTDHDPGQGRQGYRSGRNHDHGLVPHTKPKPISLSAWCRSMRKPNKKRKEAAMAAQRERDELMKRRAAWPALKAEALNRRATPNQLRAFELRCVEGLRLEEVARQMRITEGNVRKLVDKARHYMPSGGGYEKTALFARV